MDSSSANPLVPIVFYQISIENVLGRQLLKAIHIITRFLIKNKLRSWNITRILVQAEALKHAVIMITLNFTNDYKQVI